MERMGKERGERETMGTSSRKAYATFDELREVEKRNDECPRADNSSAARENKEREGEKSSDEAQVSSRSGK